MHNLRYRQIHLDFHTSPDIAGIGSQFDKKEYQETLLAAGVDSVTTFALCHHGWSYNNTEVGERHPGLSFDLLRAQFDASKEVDVNVPIYITAGVNERVGKLHPEWRTVDSDGRYTGWNSSPLVPGFITLCFNSPYLDQLCDIIKETVRQFPTCDGIFLDIISQPSCCCRHCMTSMKEKGFDPTKPEDVRKHADEVLLNYYVRTTEAARVDDEAMPVFHNSGHVQNGDYSILKYFSHLELESLPTGGWGYDHFPASAKYCHNLPLDVMGMTGKFNSTWGEFGGFKHPNALRYECAAMIAYGSKCSVGDQIHPTGKLNPTTYLKVIGPAYNEVKAKEPWCDGARNVADIALLSSDAENFVQEGKRSRGSAADVGANRVLLEGQFLYDIIDRKMDFTPYSLIILPDDINIDAELKALLNSHLERGGKLLLTGESGINEDGTPVFDIGGTLHGKSEFEPDYILPTEELKAEFCDSPFVMYEAPQKLKVTDGKSLGVVYDSYFNRSYEHFCSHQHTPNKTEPSGYNAGVIKGQIMYLAHPIFSIYRDSGAVLHKDFAVNAIRKILGDSSCLETNMPSTARVSLMRQEEQKRSVLHLLYASTISRGKSTEVINELLPLVDTKVKLTPKHNVTRATLEPQGLELPISNNDDGSVEFTIDKFSCHQMVVLHE